MDIQDLPTGYFRSFLMKLTSSRFLMPYLNRVMLLNASFPEKQPVHSYSFIFPGTDGLLQSQAVLY